MATEHVENLENPLALLRLHRRGLVKGLRRANEIDDDDFAELGNLQRNFEAVERAIEDETRQAKAEAERIRLANQPEPPRYDTDDVT